MRLVNFFDPSFTLLSFLTSFAFDLICVEQIFLNLLHPDSTIDTFAYLTD